MTQVSELGVPMSTNTQSIANDSLWRPILEGEAAQTAWEAVDAISNALLDHADQQNGAGPAGGSTGLALLFANLERLKPGQGYDSAAKRHIDRAVDQVGTSPMSPALFGGFTGVAWAMDLLNVDKHEGDPCTEIDEVILNYLQTSPWPAIYDLVGGLVGYGVYALQRRNAPNGSSMLDAVLDRLEELAVDQPGGRTWLTPVHLLPPWQAEINPQGYYNLGLAHGVPGVITVLAQAIALDRATETTRSLLDGAVAWLLAQQHPVNPRGCFNTVVPVDSGKEVTGSRLAWCYGDLGLSVALLWSARLVNRPDWEAKALEVALVAAERSFETSGCMDAGLCHGAAGNALIFNRLYQATRLPAFQDAAIKWYRYTLQFRGSSGFGGFQTWRGGEGKAENPWSDHAGLLEGSCGIALSLLAGLSSHEPSWDALLQISIPPIS